MLLDNPQFRETILWISQVIERRNLTKGQRAAIGVKYLWDEVKAASEQRRKAGEDLERVFPDGIPGEATGTTRDLVGEAIGVGGRSVGKVRTVYDEDREIFRDLLSGDETSISAAYDAVTDDEDGGEKEEETSDSPPVYRSFLDAVSIENPALEERLEETVGDDEECLSEIVEDALETYFEIR